MNLRLGRSRSNSPPRAQVGEVLRRDNIWLSAQALIPGLHDLPRNSPAAGRPISVMSSNSFRAIFSPRLIWYEPFMSGSGVS